MSHLSQQIELSARVIQTCIDNISEAPPDYTDSGITLRSLPLATRYAAFSEAILNLDSAYFLYLANKYPDADFERIMGAHETGIDISAHFIRIGSMLVREQEPHATPQDAAAILQTSAPYVITPLMNTGLQASASVELAHGLQSATASDVQLDQLAYQDGIIRFGDEARGVLERSKGRCPFVRHMPETFNHMVAAAVKIDWLLPLDFETIETYA